MTQHENLDPHALSQVEFATVRRGFHPDQVHSVIGQAATALAAAQQRIAELEQALVEARDQPPPSVDDLDDNELMLRLGDKTVAVLEAARGSAAEVERKAQERADEILQRAKDNGLRLQSQAEKALRSAQRRAETLEEESERKARDVIQSAEAQADRVTGQAEETLRSGRAEATRLETEAKERADRVNTEASENAAQAKAKVDALLLATRTQVDEQRAAADDELARLRHETEQDVEKQLAQAGQRAQRTVEDAEAKAVNIELQADTRYEERVAAGRQRGRELLVEAETKRAEVLAGLASTRRRAQLNIEQLRLGRERLVEAFAVARAAIDQANSDMDEALPAARDVAERLLARVGDDEERSLEDLEAEFELDRLSELRILSDDDPDATRQVAGTDAGADGDRGDATDDPLVTAEAETATDDAADTPAPDETPTAEPAEEVDIDLTDEGGGGATDTEPDRDPAKAAVAD